MRCSRVKNRLSEYLDSRLSATEKQRVEDHLGQCASCRILFVETEKLCHALQGLVDTPTPTALAPRIDRIPWEAEQITQPSFSLRLGWAVAAAATVVAVLLMQPIHIGRSPAVGFATSHAPTRRGNETSLVEVRRLLLPEQRPSTPQVQWVRIPMSRGVPLDRRSSSTGRERNVTARDDQIWQEVRRVSVCSRRSF